MKFFVVVLIVSFFEIMHQWESTGYECTISVNGLERGVGKFKYQYLKNPSTDIQKIGWVWENIKFTKPNSSLEYLLIKQDGYYYFPYRQFSKYISYSNPFFDNQQFETIITPDGSSKPWAITIKFPFWSGIGDEECGTLKGWINKLILANVENIRTTKTNAGKTANEYLVIKPLFDSVNNTTTSLLQMVDKMKASVEEYKNKNEELKQIIDSNYESMRELEIKIQNMQNEAYESELKIKNNKDMITRKENSIYQWENESTYLMKETILEKLKNSTTVFEEEVAVLLNLAPSASSFIKNAKLAIFNETNIDLFNYNLNMISP